MPKASEINNRHRTDLAVMIGANIGVLPPEVVAYYLSNEHRSEIPAALLRGFTLSPEQVHKESAETIRPFIKCPAPPRLSNTGLTFAEWLKAREEIHKFLTGEIVLFREMFEIPEGVLVRTDIMPFFRPAGATNRMAIEWKVKLGMPAPYEEVDVMNYKNPKVLALPTLGYISRSVRPDENTLGDNAKSPIDLQKVEMTQNQAWLNLFGWSDADNLHFLITGEHLDPETWSWFPDDTLSDGGVACGCSRGVRARFYWGIPDGCRPAFWARLANYIPLKTS